MQGIINHTCSDDVSHLHSFISSYAVPHPEKKVIDLPIQPCASKDRLGFNHSELACLLCPICHLQEMINDPIWWVFFCLTSAHTNTLQQDQEEGLIWQDQGHSSEEPSIPLWWGNPRWTLWPTQLCIWIHVWIFGQTCKYNLFLIQCANSLIDYATPAILTKWSTTNTTKVNPSTGIRIHWNNPSGICCANEACAGKLRAETYNKDHCYWPGGGMESSAPPWAHNRLKSKKAETASPAITYTSTPSSNSDQSIHH